MTRPSPWPGGSRGGSRAGSRAGSGPRSGSGPAADTSGDTSTVERGDTLREIARAQGVDGGRRALYAANRDEIRNPHRISVGQVLQLP